MLAALHHRNLTGEGQQIDLALLDAQVALLANQASNYMNGGMIPRRLSNQHPNTVPYQDFSCADGDVLVALGNDRQFRAFCALIGAPELAEDDRFGNSAGRSINRDALIGLMRPVIASWRSDELIAAMQAAKLPGGKVNEIPEILDHPQITARGLKREIRRLDGTPINFLGVPAILSKTPATYRAAPPQSGQDTAGVLRAVLGVTESEIESLLSAGIIAERL